MKTISLVPHLLALSLLLHLTEGKPMLEQIVKRIQGGLETCPAGSVFGSFNGRRFIQATMPPQSNQTDNQTSMAQAAPTNVLSTNNLQHVLPLDYGSQTFPQLVAPGHNIVQVLPQVFPQVLPQVFPQVLPQVLPAHSHTQFQNFNPGFIGQNYNPFQVLPQVGLPSHSHTPFQGLPNTYTPTLDPGFAPQVYPHSHTPLQVPPHSHQPIPNPNPGIVVIQVPVPQYFQVPVNTSNPVQPARDDDDVSITNILALLLRQGLVPNTVQVPATIITQAAAAGGGSSAAGGGSS